MAFTTNNHIGIIPNINVSTSVNSGLYLENDLNIFKSKRHYVHQMVSTVRKNGGDQFWVLNKTHLEIYKFKATQISEFDVQIELDNELEKERVFSGIFVLHMKEHILTLLEEVPGVIYIKKLECYRELYKNLYEKASKSKTYKTKANLVEKIEFIETEFPQFVI